MNQYRFNNLYVLFLASVSALGGFLFGYDWVIIGGAKPFYELYFGIESQAALQGWAISSALIGCIIGAMVSGFVADRIGRKIPLIIAAMLFIISAYGTGACDHFNPFIVFRILGGVAIGLASTLSPLYIAEVAPSKQRGRYVSINQLTIVVGILAAQIVNYLIAEPMGEIGVEEMRTSWNGTMGWRWMFWAEMIPAFIFFVLMFVVPKSPRFLATQRKDERAFEILAKIGGQAHAERELKAIKDTVAKNVGRKVSISHLLQPRILPILIIGIVLAVFQQWCGVNIIFNYAQEIFTAAGYSVGDILFNIVITGSVNLVFTFVAMRFVDSWGRRKLMIFGASGLSIVYFLMGGAYYFQFQGLPVLILVIVAIGIYSMSLAPITWVVLSEIFPNRIRGLAMSIATLMLWIASFILTFTFPLLNKSLGAYGTFWVYGLICLIGFIFIKAKLPETKGKSLEEIETEFENI
ncbi:sugar porter family MFS transporter [Portibacter marinus]|uniref:sugar porter family MFS transporter n=1 Tax=Portibacter marinus TaxID=2898660 RepID=UPI001F3A5F0D|nr:sugar porter family MFS transporter [Portibacter marinus]